MDLTTPSPGPVVSLVERAQHGDETAFEALVDTFDERIYSAALRVLGDQAMADAAAEQALVDMWRDLPRLRDPARFAEWADGVVADAARAQADRTRHRPPTSQSAAAGIPQAARDAAFRRIATASQRPATPRVWERPWRRSVVVGAGALAVAVAIALGPFIASTIGE